MRYSAEMRSARPVPLPIKVPGLTITGMLEDHGGAGPEQTVIWFDVDGEDRAAAERAARVLADSCADVTGIPRDEVRVEVHGVQAGAFGPHGASPRLPR